MRPRRTPWVVAFALTVGAATLVALGGTSPALAASSPADRTTQLFVVRDARIDEDSALVHVGHVFVTTNDNGDTGRVFAIGRRGRTVGVTSWMKHPVDCEALAPGSDPHTVWVGDIGDNDSVRSSITIAEVPVVRGHRTVHVTKYHLTYPDGPHNAETLVRDPVTGRLYIATKDNAGGSLYAVPRHLSATGSNVVRRRASVIATATDGGFLPGGHFLVIRNYVRAAIYSWPSMQRVGFFQLPEQRQGEGMAVDSGSYVDLSSEGLSQPVLRLELPRSLRRAVHDRTSG